MSSGNLCRSETSSTTSEIALAIRANVRTRESVWWIPVPRHRERMTMSSFRRPFRDRSAARQLPGRHVQGHADPLGDHARRADVHGEPHRIREVSLRRAHDPRRAALSADEPGRRYTVCNERTVFVGGPSSRQRAMFELVREALSAMTEAAAMLVPDGPGLGADVDEGGLTDV